MNNKPVAWMNAHTGHLCSGGFLMTKMQDYIPLYTHPAKTLTNEDINKLWAESHEDGIAIQQGFATQQHYFAHLILRKAQEK